MKALLSGLLICFAGGLLPEKAASQSEAVPVDATVGIMEAFRAHRLVAIGHHDDESQAFLRALISDDRFSGTVNDIVVEFGSARYQNLMDRYQRGEQVPALRRAGDRAVFSRGPGQELVAARTAPHASPVG